MAPTSDASRGGPETAATSDAPDLAAGPGRTDGPGPAAAVRAESPRIRLARLAADAAAACAGVVRLDGGPRDHWSTFVGREPLAGVVVIADDAPGRYATSVYLHAELTDLRVLADEVREAIRGAAAQHGLAERLGEIRVAITDIDDGTTSA